jgi:flagellar assembly protein FliH
LSYKGSAPQGRPSRVIKSHEVERLRAAFPALDPAVTEVFVPAGQEAVPLPDPAPAPAWAPVREEPSQPVQPYVMPPDPRRHVLEVPEEVQARIQAMERRAAAVLEEAEEAAHRRVAEADAQVAQLLETTAAEAARVRTEAEQAGYEAGYADGHQEGVAAAQAEATALLAGARSEAETELGEARAMAESIRQAAVQERAELLEATWSQVLDLAFAMARQVLKAELQLRPEALLPMLGAALARLKGEEEPQVRVSPEVLALLEEHRGRLLAAVPGARRLTLEADPSLAPGDFLVQGSQGFVDGRLERQMQVMESEMKSGER